MKIDFKVIAPRKGALERQAWEAIRRQVVQHVEDRLKGIECAEHGERPRVVVTGSLKRPHFMVEGCCQDLIDRALAALK
jgi:hypothetical protein